MAPMLATLGAMPVEIANFGYEVKWDGYRALARVDGSSFLLCSRNGIDMSERFSELTPTRSQAKHRLLLDGELVAVDRHGLPSFSALQTRMPRGRAVRSSRPWDAAHFSIQYMIFDVLHVDGRSTRTLPYADRRSLLDGLKLSGATWHVPPMHPDGPALLELMRKTCQEGIIAKRLTSTYLLGRRSTDWLKIKLNQSDDFLIIGYWSSGKHGLSSLLLGYYPTASDAKAGRNLRFCGKVGTGFTEADRTQLERVLSTLAVPAALASGALPRGAGVTWCTPTLVAQITFTEWTHDGALRHPAFRGLRADKTPRNVVHTPGKD